MFKHNLNLLQQVLAAVWIQFTAVGLFCYGAQNYAGNSGIALACVTRTQWQRYFLHSKGKANTSRRETAFLNVREAAFRKSMFLCMILTGFAGTFGGLARGTAPAFCFLSKTRAFSERRDDVLCYTTPYA